MHGSSIICHGAAAKKQYCPLCHSLYICTICQYDVSGVRLGMLSQNASSSAAMTGGLVQEFDHTVLPSIGPLVTLVATSLSILVGDDGLSVSILAFSQWRQPGWICWHWSQKRTSTSIMLCLNKITIIWLYIVIRNTQYIFNKSYPLAIVV